MATATDLGALNLPAIFDGAKVSRAAIDAVKADLAFTEATLTHTTRYQLATCLNSVRTLRDLQAETLRRMEDMNRVADILGGH
jgi:hypothetical protein